VGKHAKGKEGGRLIIDLGFVLREIRMGVPNGPARATRQGEEGGGSHCLEHHAHGGRKDGKKTKSNKVNSLKLELPGATDKRKGQEGGAWPVIKGFDYEGIEES